MISTIILIIAGVIVVLLAVLATFALRANSRLVREKNAAMQDAEELRTDARLGKAALAENNSLATMLKSELEAHKNTRLLYNKVLAEYNELAARAIALQQAMETKPTVQPKRVRKNGAQAPGEGA
jgi:uncharacterized protein YpmS